MEFFKWKDSFSVGINELDRQHQSFLEGLNDCFSKASDNKQARVDASLIERLKAYATEHFRFEEALMRKLEYKDLQHQKGQHEFFVSQIAELEKAHSAGSGTSIQSVLSFLRDWFLEHILSEDKKFAAYVASAKK